MARDVAVIALRGLAGWWEEGRSASGTFRRSGLAAADVRAPLRYDLSAALAASDNPARDVWRRPTLDLSLPDGNVRNLLEGCIGCEGTTAGHAWDGDLATLRASDSVGLAVYQSVLVAAGAVRVDADGQPLMVVGVAA